MESTKDAILERVAREGTPLIDGDCATFVWHGAFPPRLGGEWNGWGFQNAEWNACGWEVWTHSVTLPRDAYLEYCYFEGDMRVNDPFNKRRAPTGLGSGMNNWFSMPDVEITPLTRSRRDVPHGTLTRHMLQSDFLLANGRRKVYLYQPPVKDPCPLLVVWDGREYLHRARLVHIVDNLVAEGRIRPVALALVEHGGTARFLEYLCSDATVAFAVHQVLPLARQRLNLLDIEDHPGAYGVLGASMGGLMALYTTLRRPEVFGKALSQSGAFNIEMLGQEPVIWDLIRRDPVPPVKVWADVGTYEYLIATNRELHVDLTERGYDITYREQNAGHNYMAWRNDVWRGLETLFPPEEEEKGETMT